MPDYDELIAMVLGDLASWSIAPPGIDGGAAPPTFELSSGESRFVFVSFFDQGQLKVTVYGYGPDGVERLNQTLTIPQ